MSQSFFPPASSSPIKSIQRGQATSSGAITIASVVTSKTFVRSFSNGASGSAGATGTETGTLNPSGGSVARPSGSNYGTPGGFPSYSGTRTFSPGTTTLTTGNFGVVLTNSTTLTADGPCYWEVVEFN